MARTLKPVSFNINDPFESKMLKFLDDQGAFSKYVKRLIQRDMDSISDIKNTRLVAQDEPVNSSSIANEFERDISNEVNSFI